jgi:TPR repeat protein
MADIEMIDIMAVESAETDAEGCFALGMNYSAGAGVAVDLVQAHKWFNIAAMRGHRDAARLRREIAEQMIDSEIGCAQRAARDWLKSHPQALVPIESMRVAA